MLQPDVGIGGLAGVAEALGGGARLMRQHVRRSVQRAVEKGGAALADRDLRQQAGHGQQQAEHRPHARHSLNGAGGRDHFGRRRFSGGERRRQRIAARQRRGHGQRAGGPLRRIRIEAAPDHLLHRRDRCPAPRWSCSSGCTDSCRSISCWTFRAS